MTQTASMVVPQSPMRTYTLPRTDLVMSRIAYGTGMLDVSWHDPAFTAKAVQGIRTAYEQGITFFDLADVYGHGRSENALGEVLKASPHLRRQIVIQSKCGQVLSPKWSPEDLGHEMRVDTGRDHILAAVEGSLKRLGVDHLDILLLHLPNPEMRPQEIAQAFDDLHQSGKVRHFGVSNHSQAHIEVLRQHVRQPLIVNQIRMGLGHYVPVAGLVDYCQRHQMQVQAFSPLKVASNILKGSLLKPPADAPAAFMEVTAALSDLAKAKDTNPSAIALAWLLTHPAGVVPIIGTSRPKYIMENCAADRVVLSDEEWRRLRWLASAIQRE